MERPGPELRFEERLRESGALHAERLHPEARKLVPVAIAAAAVVHGLAALLSFPSSPRAETAMPRPARENSARVVHAVVPLPMPRVRPPVAEVVPVLPRTLGDPPAPEPPDLRPEPWIEPSHEADLPTLPVEAGLPLGIPEPPPTGPAPEESGTITNPVPIPESQAQPVYPLRAKRMGIPGNVLLDVSVLPDGTVGEVTVLRCTPPDAGFCESAVRAVRRWRYVPGLRDDVPTQVSVKVNVDFEP